MEYEREGETSFPQQITKFDYVPVMVYGGGTMKPASFLKISPLSRRATTKHQHQMIISG